MNWKNMETEERRQGNASRPRIETGQKDRGLIDERTTKLRATTKRNATTRDGKMTTAESALDGGFERINGKHEYPR
jgi:hypothetical protein